MNTSQLSRYAPEARSAFIAAMPSSVSVETLRVLKSAFCELDANAEINDTQITKVVVEVRKRLQCRQDAAAIGCRSIG